MNASGTAKEYPSIDAAVRDLTDYAYKSRVNMQRASFLLAQNGWSIVDNSKTTADHTREHLIKTVRMGVPEGYPCMEKREHFRIEVPGLPPMTQFQRKANGEVIGPYKYIETIEEVEFCLKSIIPEDGDKDMERKISQAKIYRVIVMQELILNPLQVETDE